ncbi:MAG: hypothetical protein ED556_06300 [Winogradskyella sp.]|uniref:hypothetical protein n=1 Tax=Winogradskyella sp. TaxID=1883156 RepID=UPI000F419818|nr:hypothetical protein [Winogradskyella sp.]RNC87030.1 MAG: hypothetical protein ED556_06300 [Winogradskyella sp.]
MKSKTTLFFLLTFFTLSSCDEALECVFGVNPEINESVISSGFLDEPYQQRITAEVDNDANDNSYDYFFEVFGDLPAGIEVLFFPREIRLIGRPEEAGSFDFTVYLSVESFQDGFFDASPTCDDVVSKDFTLFVNE